MILPLKYHDKSVSDGVDQMVELASQSNGAVVKEREGNKFKNRNRMQIVANLLTIAKGGALKTHLMYRANLSYLMVTEYLNFLASTGLIEETVDEDGTAKIYRTSAKGLKYLEIYEALQAIIGTDSEKPIRSSRTDIFA